MKLFSRPTEPFLEMELSTSKFVEIRVRFTRCLYAQLHHQKLTLPSTFPAPTPPHDKHQGNLLILLPPPPPSQTGVVHYRLEEVNFMKELPSTENCPLCTLLSKRFMELKLVLLHGQNYLLLSHVMPPKRGCTMRHKQLCYYRPIFKILVYDTLRVLS